MQDSSWRPDEFTHEQRSAARRTVTQAVRVIRKLDPCEWGPEHADAVRAAYRRFDDLLQMIYEVITYSDPNDQGFDYSELTGPGA